MENTVSIPFSSPYGEFFNISLVFGQYRNGQRAIEMIDEADGAPYAVATVALVDEQLSADEVAIKNWSENQGVLESLIENEIVSAPIRYVSSGFVQVPICKLLVQH
jgi:hypothetical protein